MAPVADPFWIEVSSFPSTVWFSPFELTDCCSPIWVPPCIDSRHPHNTIHPMSYRSHPGLCSVQIRFVRSFISASKSCSGHGVIRFVFQCNQKFLLGSFIIAWRHRLFTLCHAGGVLGLGIALLLFLKGRQITLCGYKGIRMPKPTRTIRQWLGDDHPASSGSVYLPDRFFNVFPFGFAQPFFFLQTFPVVTDQCQFTVIQVSIGTLNIRNRSWISLFHFQKAMSSALRWSAIVWPVHRGRVHSDLLRYRMIRPFSSRSGRNQFVQRSTGESGSAFGAGLFGSFQRHECIQNESWVHDVGTGGSALSDLSGFPATDPGEIPPVHPRYYPAGWPMARWSELLPIRFGGQLVETVHKTCR